MHHTGVFSRFLRCHNGIDRNRAEFTIREHRGQERCIVALSNT
jgi:hypothetical protein